MVRVWGLGFGVWVLGFGIWVLGWWGWWKVFALSGGTTKERGSAAKAASALELLLLLLLLNIKDGGMGEHWADDEGELQGGGGGRVVEIQTERGGVGKM
jgi:hypothetical protein